MDTFTVLAISGSLRAGSNTTAVLRAAVRAAGPDVTVRLWDSLAAIPPFNEDHEDRPDPAVTALRQAVNAADALLIGTPEYNGAFPGQLKNALDWASRPYGDSVLTGKPVALVGVSPSDYGAEWARDALGKVLTVAGAAVLGRKLCVPRADQVVADGEVRDEGVRAALAGLLGDLRGGARTSVVAGV